MAESHAHGKPQDRLAIHWLILFYLYSHFPSGAQDRIYIAFSSHFPPQRQSCGIGWAEREGEGRGGQRLAQHRKLLLMRMGLNLDLPGMSPTPSLLYHAGSKHHWSWNQDHQDMGRIDYLSNFGLFHKFNLYTVAGLIVYHFSIYFLTIKRSAEDIVIGWWKMENWVLFQNSEGYFRNDRRTDAITTILVGNPVLNLWSLQSIPKVIKRSSIISKGLIENLGFKYKADISSNVFG